MVTQYPTRAARLSASIEKAFGEDFTFEAYRPTDDVNGRYQADPTRTSFTVRATWNGPSTSKTPGGRGSASDERAHNWTGSMPSVNIEDARLPWTIQPGDKVTRLLDGAIYAAGAAYADGFGRTTIPLTARKRWVIAPAAPALIFTIATNSQFIPLI